MLKGGYKMAYYFMVEPKRGKFIPLKIKNSIYFQTEKTKYSKECAYSLEEIDNFTMMFNHENELRNALVLEGLLPIELKDKPLSTRLLTKGAYEKVRYSFLYQKDIDYIADPTMVVEFIMKKYYENDFVFIQKFANNFSKYYECSSTAPEVLQASTSSIRESKRNKLFETIDQNGDLLITRLVKLLILKHKEHFDGTIAYSNEVNYRNLHTVIAFINNYYNNQENANEQLIIQEYLQIKPAKSSQKEIVVKTKTRKKTHTPLEGQLSIFK